MTREQDRQRAVEFGAYLDAAMDAAGITQAQLARKMGIGESLISRWRRGTVPEMDGLRALADALGKPRMELFIRAGRILPEEAGYTGPMEQPTREKIMTDPLISKRGKRLLLHILDEFDEEDAESGDAQSAEDELRPRRQRRGA